MTTRGNWQGVYGADGVYLARDLVDSDRDHLNRRELKAGIVVWPGISCGGKVVDDQNPDLLQSVIAPGRRCQAGNEWRES